MKLHFKQYVKDEIFTLDIDTEAKTYWVDDRLTEGTEYNTIHYEQMVKLLNDCYRDDYRFKEV